MRIHESITAERLQAAVEATMFDLEMLGFCISCGEEAEGVEPDAEGYRCANCGKRTVYGAEQLFLRTQA